MLAYISTMFPPRRIPAGVDLLRVKMLSSSLLLSRRAVDIPREVNGVRSKGTYPCSCCLEAFVPFCPSSRPSLHPIIHPSILAQGCILHFVWCLCSTKVALSRLKQGLFLSRIALLALGLNKASGLVAHYFQMASL